MISSGGGSLAGAFLSCLGACLAGRIAAFCMQTDISVREKTENQMLGSPDYSFRETGREVALLICAP